MTTVLDIKDLSYEYEDGTKALTEINLAVDEGQKVALIGPNGAGKSTLLLAMGLFVKFSGSIFVDGIRATASNAGRIRTIISSVLQDPDEQLFMPSLFDDVAFGPLNMNLSPQQVLERTDRALKTVGLEALKDRSPHHLSAGQKRLAAIATVLSMEPRIITIDEPDTSLDPRSRNNLVKLLSSLPQTLIVATCNMDFAARLCQRAVLMDKGKIIADGRAVDIMTDAQLMERHGLEVAACLKAQ